MTQASALPEPANPPALCAHHRVAIEAMARHGHVDAEVKDAAARDMARQCCTWRPDTKETP